MEIEHVASIFNAGVITTKGPSFVKWDDDFCIIFINAYLNKEKKREVFFHELCHPLQHAGSQDQMPQLFMEWQEIQASNFQLYAAMPVYTLEEFKHVPSSVYTKVLAEEFYLTEKFVTRRLEQIQRRIFQKQQDELLRARLRRASKPLEYTDETKRILSQLQRQLKRNNSKEA